jgi:hypothetical protein
VGYGGEIPPKKISSLHSLRGLGHELSAEDTESMLQHSSKDVTVDEVEETRRSIEDLDLADSADEGEESW